MGNMNCSRGKPGMCHTDSSHECAYVSSWEKEKYPPGSFCVVVRQCIAELAFLV